MSTSEEPVHGAVVEVMEFEECPDPQEPRPEAIYCFSCKQHTPYNQAKYSVKMYTTEIKEKTNSDGEVVVSGGKHIYRGTWCGRCLNEKLNKKGVMEVCGKKVRRFTKTSTKPSKPRGPKKERKPKKVHRPPMAWKLVKEVSFDA